VVDSKASSTCRPRQSVARTNSSQEASAILVTLACWLGDQQPGEKPGGFTAHTHTHTGGCGESAVTRAFLSIHAFGTILGARMRCNYALEWP
jgi:hypothetical protein